ncbi:hypothetical protein HXZ66_18845 [Bacillus sp. A116_S68]|nr:hypothetical protein HXZ66_18845 [Bacillus sp. A116_S68]
MKHKKVVIAGIALFVLVMLGGGLFMNKNSGDWSERHREDIEENVRNYVERYKLDPDKVEIDRIREPIKFPTGEEEFRVDIRYHGEPFFSHTLIGHPDTLSISDKNLIISLFNELYLHERYEDFKPAMDYLKSLGVSDPLRPTDTKIQYFKTSLGVSEQIKDDIINAFYESNYDLNQFRSYIQENLDKFIRLDSNISIYGTKENIDESLAEEIKAELMKILPHSNYHVQVGVRDPSTGVGEEGLFDYLKIRGVEVD